MDRCELVAAIFIVAGALVYYAIWRCNSTLVDVEGASARRSGIEYLRE
jgi:hypothetical protein